MTPPTAAATRTVTLQIDGRTTTVAEGTTQSARARNT